MAYGRLFYCNITKGTLGTGSGGTGSGNILGLIRFGDILKLSLRMQKEVSGRVIDAEDPIQAVKITLGKKDARPTGGTFRLKFQGRPELGQELPKNASAEEVAQALDALSALAVSPATPANKWSVKYVVERAGAAANGSYIISIPSGLGYFPIDIGENRLTPTSFVTRKAWDQDGLKFQEIRLVQAPCAVTTDFSLVVPQQPYVVRVLAGQYPTELSRGVDEVQSLRIPSEFRGNFQVKREQAGSQPVGNNPDVAILKEALDAMSKPIGGSYSITTPNTTGDKQWNITFKDRLGESPQPLLTINVIDNPQGDLTFTLPLDTSSLHEAIRDGGGTANLVLEGEATITDAVPGSPNPETTKITLFSIPVTIQAKLSEAQVTALSETNWAIPPDPVSYIPYSPTQVLFGQQHYQVTIPFPALPGETSIPVTQEIQHNLNADNETPYGIHVTIRSNTANGRFLRDSEYTVNYADHNRLSITPTWGTGNNAWDLGPAGTGGTYIVTISTAGPKSAFQAHTHPMSQIIGLDSVLQDLSNQVAEIIAVMPVVANQLSTQSEAPMDFQTPINPTFFILGVSKYKDGKRIPEFASEEGDYLMSANGEWAMSKLPSKPPRLFAAIHDASVIDVQTLPAKTASAGVYRNSGTTTWKINNELVAPLEHVAVNDSLVYKVFALPGKTTYYATAYEKTLFTIVCNEHVLPAGRAFFGKFGVGASTYMANVAAKFMLIVEHGPFVEEEASTYGPNLEKLSFTRTPITIPIVLSPQPQQFFAGLRISNTLQAVDPNANPIVYEQVIKQDKYIMGSWSGATSSAPLTEKFAIRARVSQFDIENTPNASGFVQIALLGGADDADNPARGVYFPPPIFSFRSIRNN